MVSLVISGGQTGADMGALRAARSCGIKTGGWACKGWLIEGPNGKGFVPAPWLADWGLEEYPEGWFPERTEANVREADVTIWFGPGDSAGYWCTRKAAERLEKPFWEVATNPSSIQTPGELVLFLRRDNIRCFNAAGSRASKEPALEGRVERFLSRTLRCLMESPC